MRIVIFILLIFAPQFAFAQSPQAQVEQLETLLAEQNEISDTASKDKQLAAEFIADAKRSLEDGEMKRFKRQIQRAEFAVDLVRAMVAAALIREKAEQQEAAAFSAPQTTKEMASEVERLRKRKAKLENDLRTIQGGR